MTMGDELPVTSLVLPVLIRPVLTQVGHHITYSRKELNCFVLLFILIHVIKEDRTETEIYS